MDYTIISENEAKLEYNMLEHAKGAVIICPGGAYEMLSPREGEPVAKAFEGAGWQSYILSYRVGETGEVLGTAPLEQLAWAIEHVRNDGMEAVIVCGFSAGGHLAASLGVHWNDEKLFPDPKLRKLLRPDAMILCYPVITGGEYAHSKSMFHLAGYGKSDYYSLEDFVDEQTPPTFLWHTAEDRDVSVENSLLFAQRLIHYHVPVELIIYPYGVHGLSLATKEVEELKKSRYVDNHVAGWFHQCTEWLDMMLGRKELGYENCKV